MEAFNDLTSSLALRKHPLSNSNQNIGEAYNVFVIAATFGGFCTPPGIQTFEVRMVRLDADEFNSLNDHRDFVGAVWRGRNDKAAEDSPVWKIARHHDWPGVRKGTQ